MWGRRFGGASLLRLAMFAAAGAATVVSSLPVQAQSAADKATARQLATQGIKLYGEGKYAQALDLLQRAQTLYDAPVHLLYIARCQHRVGQLVESAETYRKLVRVNLAADAPQVFKDAKQSGDQELAEVEPKVPSLRVDVQPANVPGLIFSIDGQQVSSAVLGVDRPLNPGEHRVELSAPGYQGKAATIALGQGDRKHVSITLEPAAAQPGVPAPVPTPAPAPTPAPGQPAQPAPVAQPAQPGQVAQPAPPAAPPAQPPGAEQPAAEPEQQQGGVGVLLGLRLAGMLPIGNLDTNLAGAYPNGHRLASNELSMTDVAKAGGGLELEAGFRFARFFTAVLTYGLYGLKGEPGLDDLGFEDVYYDDPPADPNTPESATTVESTPTLELIGGGARIGTPRGAMGGYGELGFVYERLQAQQTVTLIPEKGGGECEIVRSYTGGAVRLGAGAAIPLGSVFQLSPFAGAAIGKFSNASVEGDCLRQDYEYDPMSDIHVLLTLGIGGEFLFGSDKPPANPSE